LKFDLSTITSGIYANMTDAELIFTTSGLASNYNNHSVNIFESSKDDLNWNDSIAFLDLGSNNTFLKTVSISPLLGASTSIGISVVKKPL